MTSPERFRIVAAGFVAALVLGGCTLGTVGQAGTFTGRAEASCRQTARAITQLSRPTDPVERIGFALDRYTDVERLVAEVSSDAAFPHGDRGRALRRDWLEPARASLRSGRRDLERLRAAVRGGNRTEQDRAYASAVTAGIVGVRTDTLENHDLADCATLFSQPAPTAA